MKVNRHWGNFGGIHKKIYNSGVVHILGFGCFEGRSFSDINQSDDGFCRVAKGVIFATSGGACRRAYPGTFYAYGHAS